MFRVVFCGLLVLLFLFGLDTRVLCFVIYVVFCVCYLNFCLVTVYCCVVCLS